MSLEDRVMAALEGRWERMKRNQNTLWLPPWRPNRPYSSHNHIIKWDAQNGKGGLTMNHLRRTLSRLIRDGKVTTYGCTYLYAPTALVEIEDE